MSQLEQTLKTMENQILTEKTYGFSVTAKPVTQAQLLDVIRTQTQKDLPFKFTSITDATYKKKNPLGTIFKVSQVEGILNPDYAERKQEKLDQHKPGEIYTPGPSYGTHETASVIEHSGKWYIQVVPVKSLSPSFVVKSNIGVFVEKQKSEVEPYLTPPRPPTTTDVSLRRYGISSLVAVEIGGNSYTLTDVDPDKQSVLDIIKVSHNFTK